MKCYKCRNKVLDFENCVKVHTMAGRIRVYHFSCYPRELDKIQEEGVFSRFKAVNFFWAFVFCIVMGTIAVYASGSVWFAIIFALISLVVMILAPEPKFIEEEWHE